MKSSGMYLLFLFVLGVFASCAMAATEVVVHPFTHEHDFYGGGCGFGLYWGHLINGTKQSKREQVYDWLFRDMNQAYIRFAFKDHVEAANDNHDPYDLNLAAFDFGNNPSGWAQIIRAAQSRNPRTRVMVYAQNIPQWLRRTYSNGKQDLDRGNPQLYAEIAEWIYANLAVLQVQEGVRIDVIDIANEPDFGNKTYPLKQQGVQDLLVHMIPILRELCELHQDSHGVTMPEVIAPSCINTGKAKSYLQDFKNNTPEAWDNIDICSVHQYVGGFKAENYAGITAIKGGRRLVQNEMHTWHSSVKNNPDQLPVDWVEDHLEAALLLGRLFSISVNNGVNAYHYFQGNSPKDNAVALVRTPWNGTPSRWKVYYAFRQLTSLPSTPSALVNHRVSYAPEGVHVTPFHHWGENFVWVNLTNASPQAQDVQLVLRNHHNQELPITRVVDYLTDADRDMRLMGDRSLSPALSVYPLRLEAHSLRTLGLHWAGGHKASRDDFESASWQGGQAWLQGWQHSGQEAPTLAFHDRNHAVQLIRDAGITRTLETGVDQGLLSFRWDVDSLDNAAEVAKVEVYNGSWREVWSAGSAQNGYDSRNSKDNIPDYLQTARVDLRAYGTVTKLRFRLEATGTWDFFFVDDITIVAQTAGDPPVRRSR